MEDIDWIRERVRGRFPDLLGIEFVSAGEDGLTARLAARPELCNAGGVLHGGAIMAFADTLGAIATVINLPDGADTATLESKTNFFRPAGPGAVVTGRCTALHRGRRTMTWRTEVTSAQARLVAIVTQTQMVLR